MSKTNFRDPTLTPHTGDILRVDSGTLIVHGFDSDTGDVLSTYVGAKQGDVRPLKQSIEGWRGQFTLTPARSWHTDLEKTND